MSPRAVLCGMVLILVLLAATSSSEAHGRVKSADVKKKKKTGVTVTKSTKGTTSRVSAVNRSTVRQSKRVCGNVFTIEQGEDRLITSTGTAKGVQCTTTFTSNDSKLGVMCPKFYLNKKGCSREFLEISEEGEGTTRYCGKTRPNVISSGNSLTLYYNRKKDKKRKCSYGFICQVYSLAASQTDTLEKVTPQPAPLTDVPPSGRPYCSVCGWSSETQSKSKVKTKVKTEINNTDKKKVKNKVKNNKKKKVKKKIKNKVKKNKRTKASKRRKGIKKNKVKNTKRTKANKRRKGIKKHRKYIGKSIKRRKKRKQPPVDTRIVGGSEVASGQYPWAVALIKVTENGIMGGLCGGSLITSSWILSAAHCFAYLQDDLSVMAALGKLDLPTTVDDLLMISQVIIHPDFSPWEDFGNDVSMLQLAKPLVFTPSVIPVCMATSEDDPLPNNSTVAVGWGHTKTNGAVSKVLRSVYLNIISNEKCRELYADMYAITSTMICAYSPGRDACQGDSGGGLVKLSADGRWVIVGVVSFGKGCAELNAPGVYARVSVFSAWIEQTIGEYDC